VELRSFAAKNWRIVEGDREKKGALARAPTRKGRSEGTSNTAIRGFFNAADFDMNAI
jgi:hypothetical protein